MSEVNSCLVSVWKKLAYCYKLRISYQVFNSAKECLIASKGKKPHWEHLFPRNVKS